MKFYGLRVYDIKESVVASGLPMLKRKYTPEEFEWEVSNLEDYLKFGNQLFEDAKLPKEKRDLKSDNHRKAINHIRRACNLGGAKASSGHDCALKGCLVSVSIEANQSFWLQWERYHYQDTISSMSTMHCLTKFEKLEEMFNPNVDPRNLAVLNEKIEAYNNNPTMENFEIVIDNCPQGIELCRRVTLNYLQIKTMLQQREFHKMSSWNKDFIELTKQLPYFYNFIKREEI